MADGDRLFGEYCDALNADLHALGSQLRVRLASTDGNTLSLIDARGAKLGDIPDSIDADAIVAFEAILRQQGNFVPIADADVAVER